MSIGKRIPANDERDSAGLAGVPAVVAGEPERIGSAQRGRQHGRVDPHAGEVARVHGQPRRQLEPTSARRLGEPVAFGPRRLRVDVVDRHGRDAAPVVDPGIEQAREVVVGEIRRRLHGDVVREQQPRRRDRPEMVVDARLGVRCHARARLGAEVLDDHLLQVAVALVERAERLERFEPLGARLADPDQDPAREGDPQLAGERRSSRAGAQAPCPARPSAVRPCPRAVRQSSPA